MIDADNSLSVTIGSGALGLLVGLVAQAIRARLTGADEAGSDGGRWSQLRCTELHAGNDRDHRDLFTRMAIVERDLAASRATQCAMKEAMDRMEAKLDRLLDKLAK
jgi:hypothetical protein